MALPRLRLGSAMRRTARSFWRDERGITAVEYGLIAVIIVTAIFGGLGIIGREVAVPFNQVASEL